MTITVQELEQRQTAIFQQRKIYEDMKARSTEEYNKLKEMQEEHIAILEELGKTSYKCDAGTFSFRYQEGFSLDKENKMAFFNYLKEKDLFYAMITVNSQTLNSYAKKEIEAAIEAGELDPQIPGVIKKEPVPIASLRR